MHSFGTFLIHVLTALFFIGLAGSAIVIAISFVEDFRELFGPDEPSSEPAKVSNQAPAQKRIA
ncbi:MAG TPA: hypothetical protein VGI45_18980 [Terracidiphilus sp.]|jgi:hypothetical protein